MILFFILFILAYLVGSIPNALWIGKMFKNTDVRDFGSGNVGATNAARVLGWKLGVMVLMLLKEWFLLLLLESLDYQIYM